MLAHFVIYENNAYLGSVEAHFCACSLRFYVRNIKVDAKEECFISVVNFIYFYVLTNIKEQNMFKQKNIDGEFTFHKKAFCLLLAMVPVSLIATSTNAAEDKLKTTAPNVVSDSSLNMRLINEYRNADKPSAAPPNGPKVDAWTQGVMFDFKSGKVADVVGVESNLYRVQKLSADPDKSTRWYLDGHDSFNLAGVAAVLDFAPAAQFKVGRFGTDAGYGSLKYPVPLIHSASQRVMPTMAEGVLWQGDFDELHLYAMYARAYSGGFITDWTDEYAYDLDKTPRYNLAGVWDSGALQLMLGAQHQQDTLNQYMTRGSYTWGVGDNAKMKAEGLGLYARTTGAASDILSAKGLDDTYLVTAKLSYIFDKSTLFASVGQTGDKLPNRSLRLDTDYTFPFDLSIDRNLQDMLSLQAGVNYNILPTTTLGVALLATDGYEDYTKAVAVEGKSVNFSAMHMVNSGPLKGFKAMAILNKAKEYREGSALGDTLNYYDVKLRFSYDLPVF